MAKLSAMNPLGYILNRQYNGSVVIKNKLFKERLGNAKNMYRQDLYAHYGCVNAIEFSSEGELLVSGGDDRRVLLWSVPEAIHEKGYPITMQTDHLSNIFCLAFDSYNTKIFSGGNDDQVIVHDIKTGGVVVQLAHKKPVYGLSVNPQNNNIIATAGDDGRILLLDIREIGSTEHLCVAKQKTGFHSVMFNPINPSLLATANSREGIELWDCRKPKEHILRYDSNAKQVSGISVTFNSSGTSLLALRRRLPPVLYATEKQDAICQFYHPQYFNSCTMKTCCFAGDNDEYILSGSDDFNLYMWKVPECDAEWGRSHIVLHGHRSIVNQVRYNKNNNLIASSGVEKMVKLWSTLPIGNWEGSLINEHSEPLRPIYTHDDYIYLVGHSGQRISHDYSDQSLQEDSRMLAFFDSLIQREIEGWNTTDEDSPSFTTDTDSDSPNNEFPHQHPYLKMFYAETNVIYKKNKLNRISQLIAQKQKQLARMAHTMSSSSTQRSGLSEISQKWKNAKKSKASDFHKKHKKGSRSSKKSSGKRSSTGSARTHTVFFDKENRKHKLNYNKSEKSKKYKPRSDVDVSNGSIDMPSTSTGITSSSNSIFRVVEQDSDEDIPTNGCLEDTNNLEEESLVNILPMPLNGTHDLCLNTLLTTTSHNTNSNVVAIRNDEYTNINHNTINLASGSCQNSPETYTTEDCILLNTLLYNDSDSTDCEYNYTPLKKLRFNDVDTPDSGFITGPCSSSSSSYTLRDTKNHLPCSSKPMNGSLNGHSSDDGDYPYEKFRKRNKKARLNVRKRIAHESDSN